MTPKTKPYKLTKTNDYDNRYTMSATINGRAVSISAQKEPHEKRAAFEKRLWNYLNANYGG